MPALSAVQLTRLRSQPHTSKHYLAPLVPATVFAARVNDAAIAVGARVITYDNVTIGAWTDIVAGMTLWVGSSANAQDIGILRVISATATTITVSENSDVQWADDQYLTVKNEYLPWPKFHKITSGVLYKDYNIAYTNQTDQWRPIAVMGSAAVGFLSSGSASVYFDGTESYAIAPSATIASYAWTFPSGMPASSALATPGNVTWNAAGTYWCTLTVTDSNGQTATTRRPVIILNPATAYVDFAIESFSYDGVGYTLRAIVFGDATQSDFPDRSPLIFCSQDVFGGVSGAVGFEANRAAVKFFGYIVAGSVVWDSEHGTVSFEARSLDGVLSRMDNYPAYIADDTAPDQWEEGKNLTLQRALGFLLQWHSTAAEVADIMLPTNSDGTRALKYSDFPRGPVWSQLTQFAQAARLMPARVTKQGRVVIGTHPNLVPVASRGSIATVVNLVSGDWREQITVEERQWPQTSFIQSSGTSYSGAPADAEEPIFAKAPGSPMKNFGAPTEIERLSLDSQADANTLVGLKLAWDNAAYGEITIPLAGNWSAALEPALLEYVTLTMVAADNNRGLAWTQQKLIPTRMEIEVDNAVGHMRNTLTCEIETSGAAGVAGDYPAEPPEPPGPEPPPSPPPFPPPVDAWRSHVIVATDGAGCFETTNFTGASSTTQPTWDAINTGLASLNIRQLMADPYDPTKHYVVLDGLGSNSKLYFRQNSGGWTLRTDAQTLANANGIPNAANARLAAIMPNINEAAGFVGLFIANRADKIYYLESSDYGATWGAAVQANSGFGVNSDLRARFNLQGAFQGASGYGAGQLIYCPGYSAGAFNRSYLVVSCNGGTTFPGYTCGGADYEGVLDFETAVLNVDPSDQDVLWVSDFASDTIRQSTDRGATFTTKLAGISTSYLEGVSIVYNASGHAQTIRVFDYVSNLRLYKTIDEGANWTFQEGTGLPTAAVQFGLGIVQDSPNKLYGMANQPVGTPGGVPEHIVFVSDDDGATWVGKAGADRSAGTTTGLPYNVGVVGLLPIWTEP